MIVCRKPIPHDRVIFSAALRPEIIATIEACGDTPEAAIKRTLDMSIFAQIAYADGKPLALWGLAAPAGYIAEWGMPWCMTTPFVDKHKVQFFRESLRFVAWCLTVYPRLETFCDTNHAQSAKWLRRLGFGLYAPRVIQPGGPAFQVAMKDS